MSKFNNDNTDSSGSELGESVISINRCSKVVKGGRNFSFGALVVVGDRNGRVGYGYGKANEVADAIRKGSEIARRSMVKVPMSGSSVPHPVLTKYSGAKVLIRPAAPGTGLIAGGAMRAILELAGIRDVLAKCLGSSNPANVVKATMRAIGMLSSYEDTMAKRGLSITTNH